MSADPVRLLSEEGDSFAASLLKAGRDGDAAQARRRKAVVLGAASGVAAGGIAATVGLSSKGIFAFLSGSKWLYLSAFLGTTALTAVVFWPSEKRPSPASDPSSTNAVYSSYPNSTAPVEAPLTPTNAASSGGPENALSPASADAPSAGGSANRVDSAAATLAPTPQTSGDAPSPSLVGGPPASTVPSNSTNGSPPTSQKVTAADSAVSTALPRAVVSSDLAAEVSAVKAARDALAHGSPKRSLELVDAYFGRFPTGALSSEARFLRVEALAQSGRSAEAKALAHALLAKSPQSPYAPRLRALAGE